MTSPRVAVAAGSCLVAALLAGGVSMQAVVRAPVPGARPAKGKLLIAARHLGDPNFAESVVLLVAHGAEGAMGVIVNQPTPIKLATILPELESLEGRSDRVWRGGPVLPTSLLVLVRSKKAVGDSETVFDDVRMLTSRDAFRRVLGGDVPRERLRAYAGHAGWAAGQLDAEIARGDWTVLPARTELVFSEAPEGVWPGLIERGEGQWTRRPAPAPSAAASAQVSARSRRGGGSPLSGSAGAGRSPFPMLSVPAVDRPEPSRSGQPAG